MLDDFVRDADGGITLYLQHESPGKDKEPNWLPAPEGPFSAIMRLYWPKEEALDGTWKRSAAETGAIKPAIMVSATKIHDQSPGMALENKIIGNKAKERSSHEIKQNTIHRFHAFFVHGHRIHGQCTKECQAQR